MHSTRWTGTVSAGGLAWVLASGCSSSSSPASGTDAGRASAMPSGATSSGGLASGGTGGLPSSAGTGGSLGGETPGLGAVGSTASTETGGPLSGQTSGLATAGPAEDAGTRGGLGGNGATADAAVAVSSPGGGATAAGSGGELVVGAPDNPVLPGFYADPQIALFDGTFYVYPTTDGFDGWSSSAFHVFSSPDLARWTDEGVILDLTRDVSWASSRAWAPGIAEKNGIYYYYFSADTQIGVATSSSPTGPFEDALGRPLVTAGQYGGQSIDPYAFTDDDGRSYLYFGNGGETAHVAELNDDMVSFAGPVQDLRIGGFREGSVAFKRNGIYYFTWSVDDTRSENYNVAYGMGTSPFGPFAKPPVNPILQKDTSQGILATGHNSVLALPNGDYYIAYHRFAIPGGDGTHREVCIDRLYFNEDGTIVPVVPTL